jgi:hypothetical protein
MKKEKPKTARKAKSCPYLKSNSHMEKSGLRITFETGAGFGFSGSFWLLKINEK